MVRTVEANEWPADTRYQWVVLSNTTLGVLIATINSSILLIALPDIFRGLQVNTLGAGNSSYLLWLIMGYLVVTAFLVVSFGRLGDKYGRVRMYNLGFAIFTVSSVLLSVTWLTGHAGTHGCQSCSRSFTQGRPHARTARGLGGGRCSGRVVTYLSGGALRELSDRLVASRSGS